MRRLAPHFQLTKSERAFARWLPNVGSFFRLSSLKTNVVVAAAARWLARLHATSANIAAVVFFIFIKTADDRRFDHCAASFSPLAPHVAALYNSHRCRPTIRRTKQIFRKAALTREGHEVPIKIRAQTWKDSKEYPNFSINNYLLGV